MKPKSLHHSLLGLTCLVFCHHAQAQTWNSAGPTNNWSTAAGDENWDAGVVWTQNGDALFDAGPEAVEVTGAVTFNDITFGVSGFSITNGAGSLLLSNDLASTITVSNLDDTASIAETLGNNAGGASSLTKAGAGILVLNGTANNTYSGGTIITTGTLEAAHSGALGTGAVTNNGTLNLTSLQPGDITYTGLSTGLSGNGIVNVTLLLGTSTRSLNGDYSGFTGTLNVGTGAAAGAGKIQLNGADNALATVNVLSNATVYVVGGVTKTASIVLNGGDTGESLGQLRLEGNANWAGSVTLAGDMTGTNDGHLGLNSGNGTVSGVISESGGPRILSKSGGGNLILSGANTYTGGTQILAGTLSVSVLNNTGVSGNVGTGAVISIGNAATGATLNYIGTGETTDRIINLAGTTGGATVTQSGASGTLVLTSDLSATGIGAKTLTLNGATVATGEFSGRIVDGSGTTALAKNGGGTWTISGDNLHTGTTTVTGGVLILGHANALGSTSAGTVQSGGSEIRLTGGLVTAAEPLTINGGGIGNQGALRNFSGDNTYSGTITLGAQSRINSDAGTLTLSAATSVSGAFNLVVGGAGNTTISGAMANGTGGLVKDGAGTLTLAGTNTYSGATQVNGGVLKLDFSTNDTSKLSNTTALTLGNGTIELAGGSHTEIVSATTLAAGTASKIIRSSGTSVLNLNNITVNAGATLNLAGNNLATTDVLNTNGILGGWATVTIGGVTDWATNSTNAADGLITAYTGYTDVTRLGPGAVPNDAAANVRIIEGGVSGNITLAGGALTEIHSLKNDATGGSAIIEAASATDVLMIGNQTGGGIHQASGAGSLTIGSAPNNGILTTGLTPNAAAATLNFFNESANAIIVNSAITNNGTDVVSLGKSGSGTLVLNGGNTFTGSVGLTAGTIRLGATNALGTGGLLTMGGGTQLDLNGFGATVSNITAQATAVITDNSTGAGTTTLTLTGGGAVAANLLDGAEKALALRVTNANGNFSLNNAANTFSGGIVLTAGTRMSPGTVTAGAYGTGAITVGEAATDNSGIYFATGNQTFTNDIIANTGLGTDRNGTFRIDGANLVFSGTLTANLSHLNFSTNGNGSARVTGKITGPSGISLSPTNHDLAASRSLTITLANADGTNDYAGNTTINNGALVLKSFTLALGAPDQIPNGAGKGNVIVNTNGTGVGTLNLAGHSETINGLLGNGTVTSNAGTPTLTLGDSDTASNFTGAVTGSLALTKIGTGDLVLGGTAANTFTGVTTLSGGLTTAGKATAFGASGAASGTIVNPGATLNTNSQNFGAERFTLAGGTISNNGAADQISTMQRLDVTADSTVGGTRRWDVRGGGLGGLTVASGATLTKTDANLFSVVQNPLVNDGTIQVDEGTFALHFAVNVTGGGNIEVNPGATFEMGSFGTIVAVANPLGLSGATVAAINDGGGQSRLDSAVTVTGANTLRADASFTINGDIGGAGSVEKTGGATLTLNGNSTYDGATTVSAGRLLVNGSLGDTAVTVVTGAILGGSGTVGTSTVLNTLTVNGTLAPGNSPGTLTIHDNLLLNGALSMELNGLIAGANHDQVIVNGEIVLGGLLNLVWALTSEAPMGSELILIANDGTDALTGSFSNLVNLATVTDNLSGLWQVRYEGGSGNDLSLLAIPEPSTSLLALAGALCLSLRRRRVVP